MEKESKQLLREATVNPTDELIAQCLGATSEIYNTFLVKLKSYDITLMDWRYYNDGKAWLSKGEYHWCTTRGTHKTKPIFWVSIWEGFFKISFNFPEKCREKLSNLPLNDGTREWINQIEPRGDKMKSFPIIFDVTDDQTFEDIFILSQFRKEN